MSHPSMTAIVEALAPFAGGPGTPFPKPEDFRRAADALKTAPALDEYVRGLEEALKPFAAYQAAVAGRHSTFVEIGYYADGVTVESTAQNFGNAATALGGKP